MLFAGDLGIFETLADVAAFPPSFLFLVPDTGLADPRVLSDSLAFFFREPFARLALSSSSPSSPSANPSTLV